MLVAGLWLLVLATSVLTSEFLLLNFEFMTRLFIRFFCVAITVSVFAGCKEHESDATDRKNAYTPVLKDREDSLYHDVMKGHDTAMAKMGKLSGYIKQVDKAIDSLRSAKKKDTEYLHRLVILKQDLTQADYNMNRWMEEFKADSAQNDKEKRVAYLEKEKDKVNRMKERVLSSILSADSIFKAR